VPDVDRVGNVPNLGYLFPSTGARRNIIQGPTVFIGVGVETESRAQRLGQVGE
jgi:hypothetical protein